MSYFFLNSSAALTTECMLPTSKCSRETWAWGWDTRRTCRAASAFCMFLQARQSCTWASWLSRRSHRARPIPLNTCKQTGLYAVNINLQHCATCFSTTCYYMQNNTINQINPNEFLSKMSFGYLKQKRNWKITKSFHDYNDNRMKFKTVMSTYYNSDVKL